MLLLFFECKGEKNRRIPYSFSPWWDGPKGSTGHTMIQQHSFILMFQIK